MIGMGRDKDMRFRGRQNMLSKDGSRFEQKRVKILTKLKCDKIADGSILLPNNPIESPVL